MHRPEAPRSARARLPLLVTVIPPFCTTGQATVISFYRKHWTWLEVLASVHQRSNDDAERVYCDRVQASGTSVLVHLRESAPRPFRKVCALVRDHRVTEREATCTEQVTERREGREHPGNGLQTRGAPHHGNQGALSELPQFRLLSLLKRFLRAPSSPLLPHTVSKGEGTFFRVMFKVLC